MNTPDELQATLEGWDGAGDPPKLSDVEASTGYQSLGPGGRMKALNQAQRNWADRLRTDDAANYGDSNVTSYLSSFTGNIAAGNVTVTGNIRATRLTLTSVLQFANLTTTQINSVSSPLRGMTAYNYNTGNIQVYNGAKWANVTLS